MGAQGIDGEIGARKVCFAQGCVDFIVTDLVQEHRWSMFAAFEAWHQVVHALACIRGDRTPA
jgi:hypothetical protein